MGTQAPKDYVNNNSRLGWVKHFRSLLLTEDGSKIRKIPMTILRPKKETIDNGDTLQNSAVNFHV